MPVYIALLRGINVGGSHILPMKELETLLVKLGCGSVKTYIQSGNVVFTHTEKSTGTLQKNIADAILAHAGFKPDIMVLTRRDLEKAVEKCPFEAATGKMLHCFFLERQPKNPDGEKMNALRSVTEQFHTGEKVFYLYAPDGIGRSKLAAQAEKCLGVAATARNWNTVQKLLDMSK